MIREDAGTHTEADAAAHAYAHRPLPDTDVDADQPPYVRLVSDPDPAEIYARLVSLQRTAS
jgi:hypothetical protein